VSFGRKRIALRLVNRPAFSCALGLSLIAAGGAIGGQVSPTGMVIDPSSPVVKATQRVSRPRGRATADATRACGSAGDCNDRLPCTEDLCVNGACMNLPIPGCVPCKVSYSHCPIAEIVFIMDTSGSMRDEATALCSVMNNLESELASIGITAIPIPLGITQTPGGAFDCLFDSVVSFFGDVVPGPLPTCPFPNGSSPYESWGPATAIVAEYYPWRTGTTRIIVPISDEGPCNGSRPEGCNDPGDDRDSITNAIAVATARGVIVSPIAGTSSDACVINLGTAIAAATGGHLYQTKDPMVDFKDSIISIIQQTCQADDRCDDASVCTSDDRCNEGVCRGTPIAGCRTCLNGLDCDDQSLCTLDSCVGGLCQWAAQYNPQIECCAPSTGTRVAIDDGNPCTVDTCDSQTGRVDHTNQPVGVSCDDGLPCTISDECDGAGVCLGRRVSTVNCLSDADCYGHSCVIPKGSRTGSCECSVKQQLCLTPQNGSLPSGAAYAVGEEVIVSIELGDRVDVTAVSGGQFLVSYNPAALKFLGTLPGSLVDPSSPFSEVLMSVVDETAGTVFYAVGVTPGGQAAYGPAIMAGLRFRALSGCASTSLCFVKNQALPQGNPKTRLVDSTGHNEPFDALCTTGPENPGCEGGVELDLHISGTEPVLSCPSSVTQNADAGRPTATVSWSSPTASSPCGRSLQLECHGTDGGGLPIDSLAMSGGVFVVGDDQHFARFSCTAVDSSGLTGTCEWTVRIRPENTFNFDLQLSPPMTFAPIVRCIEFEFFADCVSDAVVVAQPVLFGGPFAFPGYALGVSTSIPMANGRYLCVTARDPLHTLRSSAHLTIENGNYVASFVGDPRLGGNWLINGDLNGDCVIDILDLSVAEDQYQRQAHLDPNTLCGDIGPHADLNGDGWVTSADLAFIGRSFLMTDKSACCGTATAGAPSGIEEITLEELSAMGYGDLSAADINGDGIINRDDMTMLIERESAKTKTQRP